jgi:transposase
MDLVQDAPQTLILAEDEATRSLQATTSAVWAPRGETPEIYVDPGRAHAHFYGTLNLHTGDEIVSRSDQKNALVSAQHLCQILTRLPAVPILLLWDRASWHFGPPIQAVLAAHPRLELCYFPTASPELNPQEQVWKATRSAMSHNHQFLRLDQLADAWVHH